MGRHTGVKPFKCDLCDKEFISTITFKRHAIVHSGMVDCFAVCWRLLQKGKTGLPCLLVACSTSYMCELNETSVFPLQKALLCLFQGRSHLSALSVEGVLHGLLISKFTCQCTARINHTSVASVRRCSLALAHWRNTSEPTQVCNSFLMYPVVSPLILSLFFVSSSSLPSISFLRTCSSNRGRET